MKKVLVLGAGLVAKPLVRYLLEHNFQLTVASRTLSKAEALIDNHPNGKAVKWTVDEKKKLDEMVENSDVAISLLPYIYHLEVAELCLKHKKHLITTSYVKPEMKALNSKAKEAGVLFLNEIGLDPGIDHMSAMRLIHYVQDKGGKVISFKSYCGALPAPEAADNPLKYKFGWSPRGVVLAGRNDAKFLWEGKEVYVKREDLFATTHEIEVEGVGKLEVYPNRDSISYIELYGLKGIKTMFRGTLRYPGWCSVWKVLSRMGYLELEEVETDNKTYLDLTAEILKTDKDSVKNTIKEKFEADNEVLSKLEWIGIFENKTIAKGKLPILDVLADLLVSKMSYKDGERDMTVLYHEVIGEYQDGKKEKLTSTLVDFGVFGKETSVARTVALPAAIATKLLLEGKIKITGVHIPVIPEIYNPVLDELENSGIVCKEKIMDEK